MNTQFRLGGLLGMAATALILVQPVQGQLASPGSMPERGRAAVASAREAKVEALSNAEERLTARRTSSPAERKRVLVRAAALNLRIASMLELDDPRAEHRLYKAAGHLYAVDPIGARRALVLAASHAANRGDVVAAANYHMDVAWVISQQVRRTREDVDLARSSVAKAALLVSSREIHGEARERLLLRTH